MATSTIAIETITSHDENEEYAAENQPHRQTKRYNIFESNLISRDPRDLSLTKWRYASCCLMCFANGLNDSIPGALIPHIEDYYGIGYALVSVLFATFAVGFLCAAPLTHLLDARMRRRGALIVAQLLMAAGYLMILCTPPFPVVVVAFFPIGLGVAFNLALNNSYCVNIGNASVTLGIFHGSYGVGGIIGPILATGLVSRSILWSRVYAIGLGLAAFNATFGGSAFWNYHPEAQTDLPTEADGNPRSHEVASSLRPRKSNTVTEALKNRTSLLGALFVFAYQGAEVSISGWVISFLIARRDGNIGSIGYVTAGFWGGITVGRFLLSPLGYRLGERWAVVLFTVGSAVFQVITWQVPNVIGDAVAVSVLGLLLGPVYPGAMATFSRLLPYRLQVTSIGFIGSAGSSGGAVAPLITGVLAQKIGTWVLHPVCLVLYGVMVLGWFCLPKVDKRDE